MDDSFSSPSRLKNPNGAENERMVLLKILSSHWEALEKHDSDNNCSQKQRWELWDQITKEFNAHPSVSHIRTVLQVKTLFKNMKTKAKKYQIRVEDSRLTGRIVESDAVSEIMLRVIAAQSAGSTRAVIDALKNGLQDYPVTPKTKCNGLWNKLLDDDSLSYYNENQQASSLDGMTDIKIEAEDSFDSNIQSTEIDHRELTTPERILNSVSVSMTSPESPTDVHTFGDISVTPIKDKNSVVQSESPVVPIISENVLVAARLLGFLKQKVNESNSLSSSIKRSSDQLPIELNLTKKHRMDSADSVGSSSWQNNTTVEKSNNFASDPYENHATSVDKCTRQSCCCPEYHKEMLAMAQSEHNMRMAVHRQELELRQLEMSIKESERESQEIDKCRKDADFKAKSEETKGKRSEHMAKMKLIQLEIEVAQSRRIEKTNKWQMINGSKEI